MANHYITNYGDDDSDGLSFKHALRHISERQYFSGILYISGYFEGFYIPVYNSFTMTGYDKTIINGLNEYSSRYFRGLYYNIEFYNFDYFAGFDTGAEIRNCHFHDINRIGNLYVPIRHCIFNNINRFEFIRETGLMCYNNTVHNCDMFICGLGGIFNSIVSNTKVYVTRLHYIENTLFINCEFKFTGGGLGTDETIHSYPQGEDDLDKMYSLRYRMVNVYGGEIEEYFINCIYYSDSYNNIFIDADNNNFNLIPNSIAEHASFSGGYIGAKEVGIKLDNLTFTNINGTSGLIINDTQNAYIESDIIDFGEILEIKNIDINTIIAYKNGHQINFENNLGNVINQGNNALINDMHYITLNDIIEKNDTYYTHYNQFETFNATYDENYSTSGTSGSVGNGLGFVTYENGQVQEIFYEKSFSKYKIIVSNDDSSLTNGIELNILYGSIPKINVDENNIPTFGNADLNYSEFDAKSLFTRYIKILVEIKTNNLKVR